MAYAMSDDGGIQWWAQMGQREIEEYEQWLDEQDNDKETE